jgi:cation-transporting ATPase E
MDEGAAITKEVADIILLKNRFALLPEVFEEGNKIVNTVGLVAKLFLTKNFLVIYLSLASALFLLEFPLTPRRVSLFNIFAIGIPAMLIAFTNDSTSRPKRLILDIISFAAVSSLVMVTCGYVGFYFSRASAAGLASTNDAQAMVMVSIMVMISVANFLLIVSHTNPKRRKIYVLVAVGMVSMYITAVSLRAANLLLSFLHKFYEISTIDAASWRTVLSTCVIGSLVLIAAQRLRAFLSS